MSNEIYGFVKACNVRINDIVPMEDSPFKVRDDKEMKKLVESIRQFGVLESLMVRETHNAFNELKYEIVSGNRRYEACRQLGIIYVPVRIVRMMKDAAIIAMIDSNLCHRESILPSEKAAAYKMRLEAMNRQGYRTDLETDATSYQVGTKSDSGTELSTETDDSRTQIYRYIRLNELEKPLLDMVDEGRIAFTPAVELSYLTKDEQTDLIETIQSEEATPSLAQAQRMRKLSENGELDMDRIFSILTEVKGNQKESVSVPTEAFSKYVKGDRSPKKYREFVMKAIDYYCRHLERQKDQER